MASTKATMVSSRIVALNGHEFVVMLIMNRTDLMKYSTVESKWTLLLLTPYRADEFSMVMNQHTNRLYILMGSIGTPRNCECMKVLDVSTGLIIQHFELQRNPYSTGSDVQLVNVNGSIHRIGGHQTHHAIWNKADGIWNKQTE